MTNEELSNQIQKLSDIVASLAKTMNERFEQIDRRFAQIDERFNSIDEQLADIRNDHKTLVDIVKDMDLRMDKGFNELKAEDGKIHAEIASLRLELYHESGSRELVDDTLYGSLDKRLRRLEAKFPGGSLGLDTDVELPDGCKCGSVITGRINPDKCFN